MVSAKTAHFLTLNTKPNKSFKKDFIEAEELRAIFLQLPEPLSDDEMEEMLRAGNRSGGGTFNLEDMGWAAQIVLVIVAVLVM